jgi:hypothetical protein
MRIMNVRALLACCAMVVVSAALTACSSGSSGGSAAGAAAQGAGTPDASTEAIVQCYRAHGDPSFPDPVYDPSDGRWHFAISPGSAPESTQQACQHLFPTVNPSPPIPQAQFQQLVRLAQCIRHHGVPSWPDPDPDGSFPLTPALMQKPPGWPAATKACQRYWPSGGIDAHAVS